MIGPVEACKIIKNYEGLSLGYGFVDYPDHQTAMYALQTLSGKKVYEMEMRVNWAFMGNGQKEDTSEHFHLFVGDLSSEIDETALRDAFSAFGTLSDARIVWDTTTGRSRGYGFVAYRSKPDAERALAEMDGEWLGRRAIRVNWANQKSKAMAEDESLSRMPAQDSLVHSNKTLTNPKDNFESVFNASPADNNSVYVGNLPPDIDQLALQHIFGEFGPIVNVRHHLDKGFAFVNFVDHVAATRAIIAMNQSFLGNNRIKCSWGREKPKPVSQPLYLQNRQAPSQFPNSSLNFSQQNRLQDAEYDPLNPN